MENVFSIAIQNDGLSESIYAEKVGDGIYKCLESCLFIDFVIYGCEIEAEEIDGKLRFIRLYQESPYKKFVYVWSKEIIESPGCIKMKAEIERINGYWESAMEGIFLIYLLKGEEYQLDRLFEIIKAG